MATTAPQVTDAYTTATAGVQDPSAKSATLIRFVPMPDAAELLIAAAAALASAIALTRRSSQRRRALAVSAAFGVSLMMAALWSQRARSAATDDRLARYRPADRTLEPSSEWASSRACRSCHPDEYASWRKTFHSTMTQQVTPETMAAEWAGVTLRHQGRRYHLLRDGDQFLVDMPVFGTIGERAGERMVRPVVMSTGSHHQQLYWLPVPQADLPVNAAGADGFDELCEDCHGNDADGGEASPLAGAALFTGDIREAFDDHVEMQLLARATTAAERQAVIQHAARLQLADRLVQFPFAWMIRDQRWVHEDDTFVHPPPSTEVLEPWDEGWSNSCDQCHATGARFRPSANGDYGQAAVADLSISCESCHGSGTAHVRRHRNPIARYTARLGNEVDDIILPTRLDKQRNAAVCGQCHCETWELDDDLGRFEPGDKLEDHRRVVQFQLPPYPDWLADAVEEDDELMASGFWRDGTIRIAGRDYNGLRMSACHLQGELTCTTCHQMHGSDPDDQLKPEAKSNEICVGCHGDIGADVSAHTHHRPDSPGSSCMDCHMPHTTVGLMNVMRAHRIDSPSAEVSHRTGRPNACNLCHLDHTLAQVAETLSTWYGQQPPAGLNDDAAAAAVEWLIAGDAVQRAVAAWHMGYEPARRASGAHWQAPLLAQLLTDPYGAVRYVAGHSLSTLPGYADFDYDFVADQAHRMAAKNRAVAMHEPVAAPRATLVSAEGLDQARLRSMAERRDDSPVTVNE